MGQHRARTTETCAYSGIGVNAVLRVVCLPAISCCTVLSFLSPGHAAEGGQGLQPLCKAIGGLLRCASGENENRQEQRNQDAAKDAADSRDHHRYSICSSLCGLEYSLGVTDLLAGRVLARCVDTYCTVSQSVTVCSQMWQFFCHALHRDWLQKSSTSACHSSCAKANLQMM